MGLGIFTAPITGAVQAVGNVLDDLFTSDEERLTRDETIQRLIQNAEIAQAEIDKVEASHRSLFVAGWRPFIGWICGFGVAWTYVGLPVLLWAFPNSQPPAIAGENLIELVVAMLGFGGLRTVEKLKGKAK